MTKPQPKTKADLREIVLHLVESLDRVSWMSEPDYATIVKQLRQTAGLLERLIRIEATSPDDVPA